MIVVNLYGGPCSGKSTAAAVVFADLKNHGINAELVGEYAKELIYQGKRWMLGPDGDQKAIFEGQLQRLQNLEASECAVAVSDSPLLQSLVYARGRECYQEIRDLALAYEACWSSYHYFINRTEHYSTFGRVHTLEQSLVKDQEIRDLMRELSVPLSEASGGVEGQRALAREVRTDILIHDLFEDMGHAVVSDPVRSDVRR